MGVQEVSETVLFLQLDQLDRRKVFRSLSLTNLVKMNAVLLWNEPVVFGVHNHDFGVDFHYVLVIVKPDVQLVEDLVNSCLNPFVVHEEQRRMVVFRRLANVNERCLQNQSIQFH